MFRTTVVLISVFLITVLYLPTLAQKADYLRRLRKP